MNYLRVAVYFNFLSTEILREKSNRFIFLSSGMLNTFIHTPALYPSCYCKGIQTSSIDSKIWHFSDLLSHTADQQAYSVDCTIVLQLIGCISTLRIFYVYIYRYDNSQMLLSIEDKVLHEPTFDRCLYHGGLSLSWRKFEYLRLLQQKIMTFSRKLINVRDIFSWDYGRLFDIT